jgi:AAA domain
MPVSLQRQQRHKRIQKMRLIVGILALLLLIAGAVIWILNIEHRIQGDWSNVLPPICGVLAVGLALCQWLFPFSPVELEHPTVLSSLQISSTHSPSTENVQHPLVSQPLLTDRNNSQQIKKLTGSNRQIVFRFNEPLANSGDFFGRVRERTILIGRTRNGACTSLVGPRRIGKTWLITYLKLVAAEELNSRFRIAYLDATMPSCATVAGFTAEVLKELGVSFPMNDHKNLGLTTLETVVKDLKQRNQIPVLCIDEFEGICRQQDFNLDILISLRAIAQAGLCLVVTSKHPLVNMVVDRVGESGKTSPFFNVFEQLTLKPFDKQEAEKFAQVKGDQVGFTEQERQQLLKYGQKGKQQWFPLRLQLVGKMLQEDKILAERESPDYYRPEDPAYWSEFEKRLEETFRGVVP